MDMLQQSALMWKEMTEYSYLLTYGYKRQLYKINLTFSLGDYPHLAGFQYEKMIKPRLQAIIHLKEALDNEFILFYAVQFLKKENGIMRVIKGQERC